MNHRFPERKDGRIIAPAGTPVRCKVLRIHKDSVVFQLEHGAVSYLEWPQAPYQTVNATPEKIDISDSSGPLLTYTPDTAIPESAPVEPAFYQAMRQATEEFMKDEAKFVYGGGRPDKRRVADPYDINCGLCEEWSERVREIYRRATGRDEVEVLDPGNITGNPNDSLSGHVFLRFRGKFYDSECPEGVSSWEKLPLLSKQVREAVVDPDEFLTDFANKQFHLVRIPWARSQRVGYGIGLYEVIYDRRIVAKFSLGNQSKVRYERWLREANKKCPFDPDKETFEQWSKRAVRTGAVPEFAIYAHANESVIDPNEFLTDFANRQFQLILQPWPHPYRHKDNVGLYEVYYGGKYVACISLIKENKEKYLEWLSKANRKYAFNPDKKTFVEWQKKVVEMAVMPTLYDYIAHPATHESVIDPNEFLTDFSRFYLAKPPSSSVLSKVNYYELLFNGKHAVWLRLPERYKKSLMDWINQGYSKRPFDPDKMNFKEWCFGLIRDRLMPIPHALSYSYDFEKYYHRESLETPSAGDEKGGNVSNVFNELLPYHPITWATQDSNDEWIWSFRSQRGFKGIYFSARRPDTYNYGTFGYSRQNRAEYVAKKSISLSDFFKAMYDARVRIEKWIKEHPAESERDQAEALRRIMMAKIEAARPKVAGRGIGESAEGSNLSDIFNEVSASHPDTWANRYFQGEWRWPLSPRKDSPGVYFSINMLKRYGVYTYGTFGYGKQCTSGILDKKLISSSAFFKAMHDACTKIKQWVREHPVEHGKNQSQSLTRILDEKIEIAVARAQGRDIGESSKKGKTPDFNTVASDVYGDVMTHHPVTWMRKVREGMWRWTYPGDGPTVTVTLRLTDPTYYVTTATSGGPGGASCSDLTDKSTVSLANYLKALHDTCLVAEKMPDIKPDTHPSKRVRLIIKALTSNIVKTTEKGKEVKEGQEDPGQKDSSVAGDIYGDIMTHHPVTWMSKVLGTQPGKFWSWQFPGRGLSNKIPTVLEILLTNPDYYVLHIRGYGMGNSAVHILRQSVNAADFFKALHDASFKIEKWIEEHPGEPSLRQAKSLFKIVMDGVALAKKKYAEQFGYGTNVKEGKGDPRQNPSNDVEEEESYEDIVSHHPAMWMERGFMDSWMWKFPGKSYNGISPTFIGATVPSPYYYTYFINGYRSGNKSEHVSSKILRQSEFFKALHKASAKALDWVKNHPDEKDTDQAKSVFHFFIYEVGLAIWKKGKKAKEEEGNGEEEINVTESSEDSKQPAGANAEEGDYMDVATAHPTAWMYKGVKNEWLWDFPGNGMTGTYLGVSLDFTKYYVYYVGGYGTDNIVDVIPRCSISLSEFFKRVKRASIEVEKWVKERPNEPIKSQAQSVFNILKGEVENSRREVKKWKVAEAQDKNASKDILKDVLDSNFDTWMERIGVGNWKWDYKTGTSVGGVPKTRSLIITMLPNSPSYTYRLSGYGYEYLPVSINKRRVSKNDFMRAISSARYRIIEWLKTHKDKLEYMEVVDLLDILEGEVGKVLQEETATRTPTESKSVSQESAVPVEDVVFANPASWMTKLKDTHWWKWTYKNKVDVAISAFPESTKMLPRRDYWYVSVPTVGYAHDLYLIDKERVLSEDLSQRELILAVKRACEKVEAELDKYAIPLTSQAAAKIAARIVRKEVDQAKSKSSRTESVGDTGINTDVIASHPDMWARRLGKKRNIWVWFYRGSNEYRASNDGFVKFGFEMLGTTKEITAYFIVGGYNYHYDAGRHYAGVSYHDIARIIYKLRPRISEIAANYARKGLQGTGDELNEIYHLIESEIDKALPQSVPYTEALSGNVRSAVFQDVVSRNPGAWMIRGRKDAYSGLTWYYWPYRVKPEDVEHYTLAELPYYVATCKGGEGFYYYLHGKGYTRERVTHVRKGDILYEDFLNALRKACIKIESYVKEHSGNNKKNGVEEYKDLKGIIQQELAAAMRKDAPLSAPMGESNLNIDPAEVAFSVPESWMRRRGNSGWLFWASPKWEAKIWLYSTEQHNKSQHSNMISFVVGSRQEDVTITHQKCSLPKLSSALKRCADRIVEAEKTASAQMMDSGKMGVIAKIAHEELNKAGAGVNLYDTEGQENE